MELPALRGARELPLRTRAAARLGGAAAAASRALRRGSGTSIGGKVALAVDRDALSRLAAGRTVALVSGTNGKSTTTRFIAAALGTMAPVASNRSGSNLPAGIVTALAADRAAPAAALEVDESYLPRLLAATRPSAVALLNLSRDQLDRVGEVRAIALRWRAALMERPATTVVANADDPLVAWAAMGASAPVWVAAGQLWTNDSVLCPACGEVLHRNGADWWCRCGLRRPAASWRLDGHTLVDRTGRAHRLDLALPGRANLANAAVAIATATALGVPTDRSLRAVAVTDSVSGRYATRSIGTHRVRLLLAKNPAGWAELFDLLESGSAPVLVTVNARPADGGDPSWLWDVPFERLRGRTVLAAGDRRLELALRLSHAGVRHELVRRVTELDARDLPPQLDALVTYTAFRELLHDSRAA
ncbi:MAG TPA: MurT ligase domain-containing protein [Streptosporangiales bacterium]